MGMRRLGCALAGLIALSSLAAACAVSRPASSPTTSAPQPGLSLVALGDSVPRGTNCHCTPYPSLSADGLAKESGRTVTATNDSVAGATTSDVLDQLRSDDSVIEHVRTADIVEVEIGANDVGYSASCGPVVSCYTPKIPTVEKNLAAIVRRIHELAAGHKRLVVLLDYWSVWLGGRYAAAKGETYVAAAEQMTDDVNAVIGSTAAKSGSAYVDLRAAFKGPDYSYDETHYLASDGDHPNAAGHERIAQAAETVIEKDLHVQEGGSR
jgi:lysophospholipase L1-like esterase